MTRSKCSWCGQPISFFRRFVDRDFCCSEHKQAARRQTDQLAVTRLTEYLDRIQSASAALPPPPMAPRPVEVARERRATPRVPTVLEVRYRVMAGGSVTASGSGRTVNLSKGGILFTTEGRLMEGETAELLLAWPTGLKMVVGGRLVRSNGFQAAIVCESYRIAAPAQRAQSA